MTSTKVSTTAAAVARARRHTAIMVLDLAGLSAPKIAAVLDLAGIRPCSVGCWAPTSINNICRRIMKGDQE